MSANTSHKVTEAAGSPHPSKRRFSATNGTPPSSTRSPLNGSPANGSNKRQHLEAVDDRLNAIEEHGVIGNMRTCALISVSAEVCWFCYPNFDSPSIFASILDRDKGGSWTISAYIEDGKDTVHNASSNHHVDFDFPAHEHDSTPTTLPPAPPTVSNPSSRAQSRNNPQAGKKQPSKTTAEHQQQRELVRRYVTHKQLYHSDTNVLISRFLSEDGVGQVLDYMPAGKVTESAKRWLVRELTVVRGQMTFQVTLTPAFNYARDTHTVAIEPYGARFVSDKLAMELRTTKKLQWDLTDDGKGVTCLVELNENEREVFIFCESERCPGGDWKTGSSEGDALFVANEPKQKDDVRHEWNEGVDEVVNPPAEADGSPRTGKDSTLHNGSGKEHEAKADDGKEVEAEADDAKQAEPQRPAEKKEEANAPKDGESSGSGAVAAEGEKGWIRKALGEIVWRSTSSLARTLDEEWEAKQDAQRAMGRQSSRNRQLSRNKSMQRTASAASTKSSHAVKNNSNNSNTTAPSKDTGTAASDACVIDKDMDDATDGKDADDGDSHPSDNDAGSDNVILSDDDLNMSDDDDDNDDQSDDDGTGNDSHSIRRVTVDVAAKLRDHTINFWREWIGKCTYNGRWREVVYRSALVLKLMTFEPTGAIVAALTTSLPEEVKGERNWDYRFTWIRDSSFVLYAFLKLGFKEEASSFMQWISQRCEESTMTDGSLQIMYGLHGEHKLEEKQLTHLAGYKDSAPVRIGNDAYAQVQLDIYGELMDTVYLSNKYAEPISYSFWQHVRKMVDWVCDNWHTKDEGIWETRGGKKDFVYSKVMCWVAIDRGIRLAEKRSFPCQLTKWRKVRDDIYEEVQTKGWNEKRKAYTQSYGSDVLDASVLIMPLVFFSAPTDPRFVSTLEQILASTTDGGLVSNNLVFRYNAEMSGDGLKGQEGTFSICTFWAVEAAARLGVYRKEFLERSRYMFEQMLGYANHLGLYSEEIGKRGEHLGNFPQAFTHLALISAAVNLDKALTHRVPGTSAL